MAHPADATPTRDASPAPFPLTARALVLGLALSALACLAVTWADLYIAHIQIGILQLTPIAGAILVLLVLANQAWSRLRPRAALRPAELLTIYAMVLVASHVASRAVLEKLLPVLVSQNYYATPANHWAELFHTYPGWAVPYNPAAGALQPVARHFYEGLAPGETVPWGQWATPLAAWGVVIGLALFAFLCLAAILRRQWVDAEKLAFPFAVLPLELTQDRPGPGSFFRSPLMWLGFAVPTLIYTLNGLHEIYPAVPHLWVQFNLTPVIQSLGRPWSDFGWFNGIISFSALGFFFFLPTEVLLTMWVFFLVARLQNVLFSALGFMPEVMPLYPITLLNGYQVAGAYVVVTGYMIKTAWPHLRRVWRQAFHGLAEADPELLPMRWAVWGLGLAALGMAWWMVKLGISPALAALQVGLYLFVIIPVMARSASETGFLQTDISFRPVDFARLVTPLPALGARNLGGLSLLDSVFMRDQRGNLLGAFLDSLKLAGAVHLRRRSLLVSLVLGLVIALGVGGVMSLLLPYRYGAIGMNGYVYGFPSVITADYASQLRAPASWDARLLPFFGSGVGITLFTAVMRTRFMWWPLAPLGMALAASYTTRVYWFCLLITWILKVVVMRYGGMKTFQFLRPLFLGFILGEFSQAIIWTLLSGLWRLPTPYVPF